MGKALIYASSGSNNELPYFRAYYSGSGDTTFSTPPVKGNTVFVDTHNGYNISTGKYTVPFDGIYMACVNYYSNSPNSGSARPVIFHTNNYGTVLNGGSTEHLQQSTTSITDIFRCHAGDLIYFGPYNASFPLSIYAALYHNSIAITCLSVFSEKLSYYNPGGILTPPMTADTMGDWSCAASHVYSSSYYAYKCFDQNTNYTSDFYHSTSTMPQWIKIGCASQKGLPTRVEMFNGQGSSGTGRMPGTFTLQGSNDNTNFLDIVTLTKSGAYASYSGDTNIPVLNNYFYKYGRMYITSSCTSDNYMNIGAINYYGYVGQD